MTDVGAGMGAGGGFTSADVVVSEGVGFLGKVYLWSRLFGDKRRMKGTKKYEVVKYL